MMKVTKFLKFTVKYTLGHTIDHCYSFNSELNCVYCGHVGIWVEEDAREIPNHICLNCEREFEFLERDPNETSSQIINQLKKA